MKLLLLSHLLYLSIEISAAFINAPSFKRSASTTQREVPFLSKKITTTPKSLQRNKQEETNTDLDDTDKSSAVDPLTKASWYAVEAFGKVFGSSSPKLSESGSNNVVDKSRPPNTIDETIRRIRDDNERQYFLSGQIDALIYDTDCIFADPFVSFTGRDRFMENLQNLGSFITKYSAKPISYIVENEDSSENPVVITKFMVKLELNLPWRPVLAWPWGVKCIIDRSTNVIIAHEESVSMSWSYRKLAGYFLSLK